MSKNLRQLREKAATKSPSVKLKELVPPADNTVATQRFIKKHVVAHHEDPAGNGDDVYKASNIKTVNRSPDHGYNPGEDEKVYEEVKSKKTKLTPEKHALIWYQKTPKGERTRESFSAHMARGGFTHFDTRPFKKTDLGYRQAVGHQDNILRSLMYGEKYEPEGKLLDSFTMSAEEFFSEKTLTPAEKAKREEIVLSMKKKNPKMPLGQIYAIATAQAIKVAESYEQKLKDERSREAKELFVKQKAIRAKYDAMNRKNTVLGRMLSALGLREEEEDLLANLYNTLDEQNKALMLNLLDSEEGINNLIEFAIEKGID